MSIANKIQRLEVAKTDIADAITAKGGTVNEGDGFEEFSNDINTIPEGVPVSETYTPSEGKLTAADVHLAGDVVATIPEGIVEIGTSAFKENQAINKVVMPDSVISIEDGEYLGYDGTGAFYQCPNLKTVEFSKSLTSVGSCTFLSCRQLIAANFSTCTSLVSIGNQAFQNCYKLQSVILPTSLTSIGNNAFNYCNVLTDIYYTGTQTQWEQISIGTNAIPSTVTIHYEYVPE